MDEFNFGDWGNYIDTASPNTDWTSGIDWTSAVSNPSFNLGDLSWLDNMSSGLNLAGGDTSWIDNYDWGSLTQDPYAGLNYSPADIAQLQTGTYAGPEQTDTQISQQLGQDIFNQLYPEGTSSISSSAYEGLGYTAQDIAQLQDGTYSGPEQTLEQVQSQLGPDLYPLYEQSLADTQEYLKDKYWKEQLGAADAVHGKATLYTKPDGSIYKVYQDGTTEVIAGPGGSVVPPGTKVPSSWTAPTTPKTIQEQLKNYVNTKLNIRPPNVVPLQQIQGSPVSMTDLTGGLHLTMSPMAGANLGAIFPSENLLQRLAGERKAEGGNVGGHNPEFYSEGGSRFVRGDGDGTSDSVPAMLARGEFVIPADVVSSLGNGDNEAGSEVLDKFMSVVRKHKRSAHPDELPEDSRGPLSYLKEAMED